MSFCNVFTAASLEARLQAASRLQAIYSAYGAGLAELKGQRSRPSSAGSQASLQRSLVRLYSERRAYRVQAYVNGTLTNPVSLVVRSFAELLDSCTAKMGLNAVVRRVFNRQGQELRNDIDLSLLDRDAQVFASLGEEFRDPLAVARERLLRMDAVARRAWADQAPPSSGPSQTRRERVETLLAACNPRALVFVVGEGRHGVEVVSQPWEAFLAACTQRCSLPAPVRRGFDVAGRELFAMPTGLCHHSLCWLLGRVVGPLWVSTGAPFSRAGPLRFVKELRSRLVARQRSVATRLALYDETTAPASDGDGAVRRLDHLQDIEKMNLFQLRAHSDQLHATLQYLTEITQELEADNSDDDKPNVRTVRETPKARVAARPALRVYVYPNGCPPDDSAGRMVVFDRDAASRAAKDDAGMVALLVDAAATALKSPARGKRLHRANGDELTTLTGLARDTKLWLTCGEAFEPLTRFVLDAAPVDHSSTLHTDAAGAAGTAGPVCCTAVALHHVEAWQRWALHEVDASRGHVTIRPADSSGRALTLAGTGVVLQALQTPPAVTQVWVLGPGGTVAALSAPTTVLTCRTPERKAQGADDAFGDDTPRTTTVDVRAASDPAARAQRWAVRPDLYGNRRTTAKSQQPGLARLGLLWPAGTGSDATVWPVVGALVAFAPWIDVTPSAPRRTLNVLLNGARNKPAVAVKVPPRAGGAATQLAVFLDDCRAALGTDRPLRLAYDEAGRVLGDVAAVGDGDTVYVSCGEAFVPPKKVLRQIRQELETMYAVRNRGFPRPLTLACAADTGTVLVAAAGANVTWNLTDARHIQLAVTTASAATPAASAAPAAESTSAPAAPAEPTATGSATAASTAPPAPAALVLEATELADGAAVVLRPASETDVRQKWVVDSFGFVQSAMDATLVLTVHECGPAGSRVVVAKRMDACNAHQKWSFQPTSSGSYTVAAYACAAPESILTALHVCGVCTYSFTARTPARQLAYRCATKDRFVCYACAQQQGDGAVLVGARSFVCCNGESLAATLTTPEDRGPLNAAVSLGVRVSLATQAHCDAAIAEWSQREQSLQPSSQAATQQRKAEPDAPTHLRVRLHKNGVVDEARSTLVLIAPASPTAMVEQLLQEATTRLRLVSAARTLYTAAGRPVTQLDLKAPDLCPEGGLVPPLWVSCGEPYLDPAKEEELRAVRREMYDLKKRMRDLCDRLGDTAAAAPGGLASDAERRLYDEVQEGRERLRELQRRLDRLAGTASLDETSRLVQTGRAVRVRVRRNGATAGAWKVCWGTGLAELLASCSEHLGVAVRRLYTSKGLPVTDPAILRVDQHLYASGGEPFVDVGVRHAHMKARAEFSQSLRNTRSANATTS